MNKYYLSPFLIQFDEGNNIILFNTINHAIVRVNKELWSELQTYINTNKYRMLTDPTTSETLIKLVNDLLRVGILYDFDIGKYKHNMVEFRFNVTTNHPSMAIWFAISGICNFVCPYCYLTYRKDGKTVEANSIQRFIKFLNKYIIQNNIKEINIVYYGGEPLLAFDELLNLHNKLAEIKSQYENLQIHELIITNGSLLTDDKIDKLIEASKLNPIKIQITLDGTKEVMDKRRPLAKGGSSFDLVYNNFIKLVKKYPFDITLRSNVDYENLESVKQLLFKIKDDLNDLVKKVIFSPHWIFETQEIFLKNEYYLSEISQKEAEELIKLEALAQELGFQVMPNYIHGPCTYVSKHGYAIDEYLRVYKCPAYLYTDKYFGIIDEEGDIKIVKPQYLIEAFGEIRKCYLSCPIGTLCYGGCRAMKHCPKERIMAYFNTEIGKKVITKYFVNKHRKE